MTASLSTLPAEIPSAVNGAAKQLTIAVGIATRGRHAVLKETLADLQTQSYGASAVLVAYCEPSDIGDAPAMFPNVEFFQAAVGDSGSCAQRNRLLREAGTRWDLIFFMDDDFYLHPDYCRQMEEVFRRFPEVQGATGKVVADGAVGPGLTVEHARRTLRAIAAVPSVGDRAPKHAWNTYGCNMIFRLSTVHAHGLRFDENLPAYAWYEDIDFSRSFLPYGTLASVEGAQGVHLGIKVGRTSGKRLGYSQVANPIYLTQKGIFTPLGAVRSISRRLLSNLVHSIAPEPYIDRRGRVKGNFLALRELLTGRIRPDRILHMN